MAGIGIIAEGILIFYFWRSAWPRRIRPGVEGWGRAVLLDCAQAAAETCDLGADLGRRAARLLEVAPKLRAIVEQSNGYCSIPKRFEISDDRFLAGARVMRRRKAFDVEPSLAAMPQSSDPRAFWSILPSGLPRNAAMRLRINRNSSSKAAC